MDQPIMKYRFSVTFHSMPDLTSAVTNFKPNYVDKKIIISFREDVLGKLKNSLNRFNKNGCPEIKFTAIQGNLDSYYTDIFHNAKLISHEAEYDYSSNTFSEHVIILSFDRYTTEY